MPNWSGEDSSDSTFGVLECKRCLQDFQLDELDESGEIPPHECLGEIWKSGSFPRDVCHRPVKVNR